jgi:electron transport complex protein RnfG
MIIAAVASGILAFLNQVTAPIIQANQAKAEKEARIAVLADATTFSQKEKNGFQYYEGVNANGEVVGFTFVASLYGYSSDVKTMVGVDTALTIKNIKILSQTETPGLGANCEKPEFPERFKNKKMNEMVVDKDGGKIQSITGATITTRTIATSIKNGLEALQKAL